MYLFFRKKIGIIFVVLGIIVVFSCCAWGNRGLQNTSIGQVGLTYSIDEIVQQQQRIIEILERDTETLKKTLQINQKMNRLWWNCGYVRKILVNVS